MDIGKVADMKSEVYILKLANGQYYIGSTNDIKRRLVEHNSGKTPSIRYKLPAKLLFSKECDSTTEARQLEHKLKSYKNRSIIKKIVKDQIIAGV